MVDKYLFKANNYNTKHELVNFWKVLAKRPEQRLLSLFSTYLVTLLNSNIFLPMDSDLRVVKYPTIKFLNFV